MIGSRKCHFSLCWKPVVAEMKGMVFCGSQCPVDSATTFTLNLELVLNLTNFRASRCTGIQYSCCTRSTTREWCSTEHGRARCAFLLCSGVCPPPRQTSLTKHRFEDKIIKSFKMATAEHQTPRVEPLRVQGLCDDTAHGISPELVMGALPLMFHMGKLGVS